MIAKRNMVVDDDALNNKICSYTLAKCFVETDIKCFESPIKALAFIGSEYNGATDNVPTRLFLDINMPEMNGWEFLNEFSKMDKHIQNQFTTYIVSSSIDPADREKATANRLVTDYLSKPLSIGILKELAVD